MTTRLTERALAAHQSQNEQEMHGNDEDPNLRIYAGDRKPASPYEPSFDGKRY